MNKEYFCWSCWDLLDYVPHYVLLESGWIDDNDNEDADNHYLCDNCLSGYDNCSCEDGDYHSCSDCVFCGRLERFCQCDRDLVCIRCGADYFDPNHSCSCKGDFENE